MRKRCKILIIAALLLVLFIQSPLFAYVKSLCIMTVWNKLQLKNSLLEDSGIEVQIPGGLTTAEDDWYPFVCLYNADETFSAWTGIPDIRLSILYNFPSFSLNEGRSRLYDTSSSYYSSFYGAYLVQSAKGERYGFTGQDNGWSLAAEDIAAIARFDYEVLVLGDFGLPSEELVFQWAITDTRDNLTLAGYSDWISVSVTLTVNGAAHQKQLKASSYLQYGEPPAGEAGIDFLPVRMYGRIYGRYFSEKNISLFFYVIAADETVCGQCAEIILLNSRILASE